MISDTVKLRNELIEYGYTDVVIFENPGFVDAFIGLSTDNRAVYDFDLMVACLMEEDSMTEEEAIEFIEYNTIRSLPYYENAPIIVRRLPVI